MKHKPLISYDREGTEFRRDNKPITEAEALEHWDAVDADWTVGASTKISETVMERERLSACQ